MSKRNSTQWLINKRRIFYNLAGQAIIIRMKLYLLPNKPEFPGKFSWIAYLESDHQQRVLFDTHYPFGSHYHIDQHERIIFSWNSLEKSLDLFFQKAEERFGPFAQNLEEILT